jgi:carbon-monoxide dehydrogenase large subunit
MTVVTPKFGMGASVLRLEDKPSSLGGRYTDDITPEARFMAMCSPVAKASCPVGRGCPTSARVHLV